MKVRFFWRIEVANGGQRAGFQVMILYTFDRFFCYFRVLLYQVFFDANIQKSLG
ncbi:hypothetical protein Hanom_Chr15g01350941 [Helianthus anomalus]